MTGLMPIGLILTMIYNLVNNALRGLQIKNGEFTGTIDYLIPYYPHHHIPFEQWEQILQHSLDAKINVNFHFISAGHHEQTHNLENLQKKFSNIKVHVFMASQEDEILSTWMIENIRQHINAEIVFIADINLVPDESVLLNSSQNLKSGQSAQIIFPQTSKQNFIGDSLAQLSPGLCYISLFGRGQLRKNLSQHLIGLTQLCICMTKTQFQDLPWNKFSAVTWKEAILNTWNLQNTHFNVAFGEKHLKTYYPNLFKQHFVYMRTTWKKYWNHNNRIGLIIFIFIHLAWSLPLLSFLTHPFWALGSLLLIMMYRLFTKIIFQESWISVILHPFSSICWLVAFAIEGIEELKHFQKSKD
jgi:hypothetical protein